MYWILSISELNSDGEYQITLVAGSVAFLASTCTRKVSAADRFIRRLHNLRAAEILWVRRAGEKLRNSSPGPGFPPPSICPLREVSSILIRFTSPPLLSPV